MRLASALKEFQYIAKREINYYQIRPTYALLFMTYRCTSRCKMCSMWQKKINKSEELTLEKWKQVIDELYKLGICHIEFFGGDALLRKDMLIDLVSYANKKNIYTEMPTNCNLLDSDTAVNLVGAGLDDLWVSLDGVEETHDTVRGRKGSFDKVDSALEAVNRAKNGKNSPRIFVNCVITKGNLNTFEKIIPYAIERGIYGIDFEYVGEITRDSVAKTEIHGIHPTPFFMSSEDSSLLINMEEAALLKRKLREINKNYKDEMIRLNTSKIDILSKDNIVSGKFPNKRCYICRDWLTVDPFGNVIGCLHFNNYHVGNLKEEALASIWKNDAHMEFIKARDRGLFDICNYCSNGAIRNNTVRQALESGFYKIMNRGKE